MRQLKLLIIAILPLLSVSLYAKEPGDKGNVIVINSVNFNESWTKKFYELIRPTLINNGYNVSSEELEIPNMTSIEQINECRTHVLERHSERPKMVIFIGDPSWLVCRELFDSLWMDVPAVVVYGQSRVPKTLDILLSGQRYSDDQLIDITTFQKKYNFTSMPHNFHVEKSIEAMQKMMPKMKRLAFISDSRYISLSAEKKVADIVKERFPNIELQVLRSPNISTEKLLDSLSSYDKNVGIIYYSWFINTKMETKSYLDDNVHKIISAFAKTPVFTLAEKNDAANNFAGGYFITVDEYYSAVNQKIADILNGTPARNIVIEEYGKPKLHLNYGYLHSYGLDPTLFPTDAEYINMPLSFLERNKTAFTALLFLLLLIIGAVVSSAIIYVSKQRQREREIKLLKQYRRLVDTMPIIYIHLVKVSDRDYLITDVNPAFEALTGCKTVQVVDRKLSELLLLYPNLQFLEEENHKLFTIADNKGTTRYYDKISFHSESQNNIEVFCTDCTNEHQAAIKLEERNVRLTQLNEKYRLTLGATGLIPWTWNLSKSEVLFDLPFSDTTIDEGQQRLSVERTEMLLHHIHPDDYLTMDERIKALLSGKVDSIKEEYRTISFKKTEEYMWVNSSITVGERDDMGRVTMLVGATLNIDAQKQFEHELRQAKEQAEEMNRLKSAFIANISHEIRTPLNAIVGFSDMIITAETKEEKEEYSKYVSINNTLLLQLIDNILDLSKIEAGMLELGSDNVDLHGIFYEQEQNIALKNNKKTVTVIFDKECEYVSVNVDINRLLQVMNNLISNAIKFTKEGEVHYGYRQTEDEHLLEFYVNDCGCGISEENLEHIFGRFVKLDNFIQGTGLGLPICQSIVEKMGGRIWAESTVGVGTTFKFSIKIS